MVMFYGLGAIEPWWPIRTGTCTLIGIILHTGWWLIEDWHRYLGHRRLFTFTFVQGPVLSGLGSLWLWTGARAQWDTRPIAGDLPGVPIVKSRSLPLSIDKVGKSPEPNPQTKSPIGLTHFGHPQIIRPSINQSTIGLSRRMVLASIIILPTWFLLAGAAASTVSSTGTTWNLMVSMKLKKVGRYSYHCPTTVLTDLENELRDWIQAEFDMVLGEDNYVLTRAAAADQNDTTEIQIIVKTSPRGRRQVLQQQQPNGGVHTIQSLALPLQWNVQTIVDQWRNAVRFTRLDLPCLGDEATIAQLKLVEVPYFPDSWTSTPIILSFPPTPQNATSTESGEAAVDRFVISTY
jgi:hypothetical protein